MSGDVKNNVIDITTRSDLRRAHERSEAFALEEYVFGDESIGFVEDGSTKISVVVSGLKGIYMTPEDAERLGIALIQAAALAVTSSR